MAMIGEILSVLPSVAPAVVPLAGAVAGIRFVGEGERALLLRFERAIKGRDGQYKVVDPGFNMLIPAVNKLARTHVRQRTVNLPAQIVILPDHTVFEVGAVLLCRVRDNPQDLYRALFETTNLNKSLTDYGLIVVRKVLAHRTYGDLMEKREEIADALASTMQEQADDWGVEIISFELSDCEPSATTAQMIQTVAQTAFRTDALETAAKKLGLSGPHALPVGLAAVLVGTPMVASASVNSSGFGVDDDLDDGDG